MRLLDALEKMYQYSPDTGGGSSPAGQTQTADAAGANEPSQETGQDNGENSGDLAGVGLSPEQQKRFDAILADRLGREKHKWEKEVEAAREKARKEAEEARLAEQQNYQELANRRQSTIDDQAQRITELENADKRAKKYEAALQGYRDQMIEHVPEHIKPLLEGKDIADQLEWLAANMEHFASGNDGQQPRYIGPPPAPKGGKGQRPQITPEQQKQVYRPQF